MNYDLLRRSKVIFLGPRKGRGREGEGKGGGGGRASKRYKHVKFAVVNSAVD